jgi:hypothetical protein
MPSLKNTLNETAQPVVAATLAQHLSAHPKLMIELAIEVTKLTQRDLHLQAFFKDGVARQRCESAPTPLPSVSQGESKLQTASEKSSTESRNDDTIAKKTSSIQGQPSF